MRNAMLAIVMLAAPVTALAQEPEPAVEHIPANETHDGKLVLEFRVHGADTVGRVVVRYRAHDATAYRDVRAQRSSEGGPDTWVAEIPRSALAPPSVDYYVVSRYGGNAERAVFATAASPHPVVVVETDDQWHERDALRNTSGHRSRVTALGEWIDYGSRTLPTNAGPRLHVDRYFHGEASYAYGMFGHIEWLRFSAGVLRGNAGSETGANEVGLYYGTSEITWYVIPWLRLRTQILFGVSQYGFEVGGKGAIVLGREGDLQLTIEGSGVSRVGASGTVRLAWRTVPHVPMAASVEVSSLPGGGDAGVRMLVEAGYEFEPGTMLRLWGGYQARTQVAGGPTIGAELVLGL